MQKREMIIHVRIPSLLQIILGQRAGSAKPTHIYIVADILLLYFQ